MANERNSKNENNRNAPSGERSSTVPNDLPDSEKDQAKLQGEETIMDLPDVKDIPGQEFVHVPPLGELADTTIASADEEGANIIGLNDDDGEPENIVSGAGGNISSEERRTLADDNFLPTRGEANLRGARMDNVDFEGEPLNEGSFGNMESDRDLDIPGSGNDFRIDSLSQSDEENKGYSIDDTDTDQPSENRTGA